MVSVHVYISEDTWSHISHSMMLIIHIGDQLSNSLRKEQVVLYKYMNIYLKEVLRRLFSTSQHVRIWTDIWAELRSDLWVLLSWQEAAVCRIKVIKVIISL